VSAHDGWNYWIAYPVIASVLILAGRMGRLPAQAEFGEAIKGEIERQARTR